MAALRIILKPLSFLTAYFKDNETGGFADRPGDVADPFHTLFGVAGLSLLGEEVDRVRRVNPVFCMPQEVLDKNSVTHQLLD